MITDFLVPLVAVGLAELGDKTQLSILLLSSKTDKHLKLLLGVMLAFLIVDGFAVLAGSLASSILSAEMIKIASGIVFILFGLFMLKDSKNEKDSKLPAKNPFVSGFVLVFLTEWGDKTQIASALFATLYNPLLVLAGTLTALTLLSIMAIYLGKFISRRVDRKLMTKIAGAVFVLLGAASLLF
ncbi:MAG: TMEM165/GDT1 family protein [Candidatus Altiarchaeales archaeon]|nr:TMEM165/GDT1 family protein [Candidatus Altiarchaeales archaeon]